MNPRAAVFISGRGSNLQALLDKECCNIRLVVSNRKKCPGVLKARRMGIPILVQDKFDFNVLKEILQSIGIQRIILLGFMKLIPQDFIEAFKMCPWPSLINLHPSLLPKYPGLNALEFCYEKNDALGVTLHEVIPEMDAGPILYQSQIYGQGQRPLTLEKAQKILTYRELFSVRRMGDVWI